MTHDFEKFCTEANIFVFECEADCANAIVLRGKADNDFQDLLLLLPQLGIRFVTLEKERNLYDEHLLDIIDPAQLSDPGLLADYHQHRKLLKEVYGHLSAVKIHFSCGQVLYTYRREAPWKETVDDLAEEFEADDEEEASSFEENDSEINDAGSQKEVEAIARKILENKEYQEAPHEPKRQKVFTKLWYQIKGPDSDRKLFPEAMSRAEELFMEEIFPKKDAELGEKIRQYQKKGFSKIATQSKLGITKIQLERHWNTE